MQDDFRLTHADRLGKPRMLGGGDRGVPEGHTFGAPSNRCAAYLTCKLLFAVLSMREAV
jgi:hypothetical protein